jgi:cardiolipin synthase
MDGRCWSVRAAVAAVVLAGLAGLAVAEDPASAGQDVVSRLGQTRWTAGNSVRLLTFPEEAWQARLDLVARAQHHVFISTFAWHEDHYGDLFREHLARVVAERRRVDPDFVVYCLVDAMARGTFDRSFRALTQAGAVVRSFNRQSWGVGPIYDARMHDKMIIVDGRWAIVGGRNIANEYYEPSRWWLDFGVELEGEAVWDLQLNFLKAWKISDLFGNAHRFFLSEEAAHRRIRSLWNTGRLPNGKSPLEPFLTTAFFPSPDPQAGTREVAVLYDNPLVRRTAATTELLVELVGRAEHEIDLMTPFPNFTAELTRAVAAAAKRGVRVRLIVNSEDAALRRGPFLLAGLPTLIELIEGGVEVWAWSGDGHIRQILDSTGCKPRWVPPVALHGKLVRIDDELTIVHSSNFNIRSTYYNTEAGVVVRDRSFNAGVRDLLDDLISLRDLRLDCGDRVDDLTVSHVVERLGPEDVPRLRGMLGNRQRWIDSMGLLW